MDIKRGRWTDGQITKILAMKLEEKPKNHHLQFIANTQYNNSKHKL